MTCSGTCEGCPNAVSRSGNYGNNEALTPSDIRSLRMRAEKAEAAVHKLNERLSKSTTEKPCRQYRSQQWWNNYDNISNTSIYIEKYFNFGFTRDELQSGKPIIGIAQTGSDISPCNRHHLTLVSRIKDGIRDSGGIPMEFPTHPIQENGRRPTATLDRNLMYLSLVEILHAYPIDAVVFLTGCDKTTPACLMAAATMNLPSIVHNVGPMLNGYWENGYAGSGHIVWKCRHDLAAGKITKEEFFDAVSASAPSVGHCNTMGTASTMNALAEALGLALPGSAAIPAAYKARGQMAYETGCRAVGLAEEDLKPSDILTREAFENAIALNTAIGGSTNAPIHLNAIARHMGVALDNDVWEKVGYNLPLLANVKPAGYYLCEEYYRAGNLPAITHELISNHSLPHPDILTVTGLTVRMNVAGRKILNTDVIRPFNNPLLENSGFLNMKGNLFNSAIMKTSAIDAEFRKRYLSDSEEPNVFQGPCAVFDGPEHYHQTIESRDDLTDKHILIMRHVGPVGYPGAAEVVNMQPSARLIQKGVNLLPCIGDGRQSGTAGCPAILNASPEASWGTFHRGKENRANLAILQDGDIIRIDLNERSVNILNITQNEIDARHDVLESKGGFPVPESQTPWQAIHREKVGHLSDGMVFEDAVKFQRVGQKPLARDNH